MAGRGQGPGGFGGGPKPTEVYQFAVLCLDRQTGKVLWQKVAREEVPHEGYRQGEGSFASSSGLTDGKHLYAYFGSRGLYCYDLDGKPQWEQDLGKMRMAMGFGEGSSPALYRDTLIVNRDNEDNSFIIALDKNTGKTLWKKPREEHTSWSTPLIIERDGKAQAVVTATGKIRSYDVASGEVLWECGGLTRNVIPCPVADAGMVYCMSGFQGNALLAIRLGRTGDLTGSDAIAWTHNKSTPYVPSPLLYDGKLYFFANNNGVLSCLDTKSGDPLFDGAEAGGLVGRLCLAARRRRQGLSRGPEWRDRRAQAVRQAGSAGHEPARREVRRLTRRRRQGPVPARTRVSLLHHREVSGCVSIARARLPAYRTDSPT